MKEDKEEKGLFEKAVDMFSSRDEKEEAEKAKKEASKAKVEKAAAERAADAAQRRASEAEAKLKKLEAEKQKQQAIRAGKAAEARYRAMAEKMKPKFIAEHKLKEDETLSHVALKHYGSATKPYWMLIYEANKETIGDNPNVVRPGTVLNIPELPKDMEK